MFEQESGSWPLSDVVVQPMAKAATDEAHYEAMLDARVCDRARVSRDVRFDGRFFSGVLTTKIYCRPICPVRPARSQTVVFFPTAAAAESAGFRPCLRCRPEAAPGSPAWQGAAATVSRALRLIIDQGALDEGGVADLAATLGIGPRHLSRLFLKYVGASPTAAARTRRVQLAKTLLTDTRLSVPDVAFAAGFQSIRRFNAVFRETYRRPPSAVRRQLEEAPFDGGAITLRLAFRPPLGWRNVVRLFSAECTPGVEEVSLQGYRRTVLVHGQVGWFSVRPVRAENQIELRVCLPAYTRLRALIERVHRMFDLGADPVRITRQLASDGDLVPLLNRLRGVRLPGAWDGFEVAVYRVVLRDVGRSTAGRVMERLASTYGRHLEPRPPRGPHILFPDAEALAQSGSSNLGLSRTGAQDLRRLAAATAAGSIQFLTASFDDLVAQLTTTARFDPATAHWIAMRSLAEPDAVPFGIEYSPLDTEHQRWRPWRSYVAVCHASAAIAARDQPGEVRIGLSARLT